MSKIATCFTLIATVILAAPAFAQEDTAPPVLLDFSMGPVVFDTAPSPVTISFCATARDNLSGLYSVCVNSWWEPFDGGYMLDRCVPFPAGTLEGTVCDQVTIPQFTRYGRALTCVSVRDAVGNSGGADNPASFCGFTPDLCLIGPCEVENRSGANLPDTDSDGIPNDADNCPDQPNANQEDRDVDLIGDACDPFPDDRDNEQAQCEADLAQCFAQGFPDQDGDGVPDSLDDCPSTPAGMAVDRAGCSQEQFCGRVDATTRPGKRTCRRSDWKNDEPIMPITERDCTVDRGALGPDDDRCVPF